MKTWSKIHANASKFGEQSIESYQASQETRQIPSLRRIEMHPKFNDRGSAITFASEKMALVSVSTIELYNMIS